MSNSVQIQTLYKYIIFIYEKEIYVKIVPEFDTAFDAEDFRQLYVMADQQKFYTWICKEKKMNAT